MKINEKDKLTLHTTLRYLLNMQELALVEEIPISIYRNVSNLLMSHYIDEAMLHYIPPRSKEFEQFKQFMIKNEVVEVTIFRMMLLDYIAKYYDIELKY